MAGKMTDASFYEDVAWDKDQFRNEYNQEAKELRATMKIFKLNQDLTKEQIMV